MGNISKGLVLALVLVVIMSGANLLIVKPANAQTISKPSVPEFDLKYVDNSYDVPPTYGIDPYTGKNVTIQAGYHVQNDSVEVIIKNQPFTSYSYNGSRVELFYNIALKGHFENWASNNWNSQNINVQTYDQYPDWYYPTSNSDYSIITYGLGGDNGTDSAYKYRSLTYNTPPYYGYYDYTLGNISVGGQVDFAIQAIIGYSYQVYENVTPAVIALNHMETPYYFIFTGQSSAWTNVETITIPNGSVSTSALPNSVSSQTSLPTPTPTLPEFPWLAIFPLFVSLILIVMVLRYRKSINLTKQTAY